MAAEVGVWPSRRDFKASQRLLAETRARAAPPAPPLHAQPLVVATIPPGPPGGEDAAIYGCVAGCPSFSGRHTGRCWIRA